MHPVSYLDWNASAPLRPEARAALLAALASTGNPSSVHAAGRAARRFVEEARAEIAALTGGPADTVVFTSGGTEANALALHGSMLPVATSAVEHASVLAVRDDTSRIPVDGAGTVALDALDAMLAARGPMLVSVMVANNETGVIQPIADIAALVHGRGGRLHCDAVQAAGRIPIDMVAQGIDLLTLSAHKLGGPQGVGALVVRSGPPPAPLLRGGGQEQGTRAGTENVAGIAAFGAAARAVRTGLAEMKAVARLRDTLEAAACRVAPATRVLGIAAPRLCNTSCLALPGAESATLVMAMDLAGIAISAGSACSSGKVRASHVLAAMGLPAAIVAGAVRVSLGPTTTLAEIDAFVRQWGDLAARIAARAPAAAA
jgi:cysteine desulfurase